MSGLPARLASRPVAPTPRGGSEGSYDGTNTGPSVPQGTPDSGGNAPPEQIPGELFQMQDKDLFKAIEELVIRQEIIAKNHWAQDTHWSLVVGGYPWSNLKHDTDRDTWTQTLPGNLKAVGIQAVPNKVRDLLNKTGEARLVDFPQPDPEPLDDSEEADGACDIARRFLEDQMGEQGLNVPQLFDERLKRALWSSSTYIEVWVDPCGGGYVPLQIKAHPQAVDAEHAEVGPNGEPTTDYVMRYVDAQGQFVADATQAAPQWQPKIQTTSWNREHLCVYPEKRPVWQATKVIIKGYATVDEGKRRGWLDGLDDGQIDKICDWTPARYMVLLPPWMRARWKLNDGKKTNGGSSDERIFFYYHLIGKSTKDYPKGADLVVSGAGGGMTLAKGPTCIDVTVKKGEQETQEPRCLEINVVQLRPVQDLIGEDPTGLPYVEMIAGAAENTAYLTNRFSRVIDKILTNPYVSPADSPVSGEVVADARSTGDFIRVASKDSMPQQLEAPQLPNSFFEMYQVADEATNSIGMQERAAQGADTSKERSGKAIQLAVSQNSIGSSSMQDGLNGSTGRFYRIVLEQAMRDFKTPQLLRYEGEDGTAQADEFNAMDFALIGRVGIKAGSGTGLPRTQKVQYLGSLSAEGFITPEEAKDAAREAFSATLGLPPNPHEQYVARCCEAWLEGPPDPDWVPKYQAWLQAETQFEQAQATFAQQQQAFTLYMNNQAVVAGGPPPITLGPEQQNEKAMQDYQQAVIAVRVAQMMAAGTGVDPSVPPQPPQPNQVPKPWVPFNPRANDTEPAISAIWHRRTSNLMSSNKFESFGPEWADVLVRAYKASRQADAMAQGAAVQPPQGTPAKKPGQQPTQQTQPTQPTPHSQGAGAA